MSIILKLLTLQPSRYFHLHWLCIHSAQFYCSLSSFRSYTPVFFRTPTHSTRFSSHSFIIAYGHIHFGLTLPSATFVVFTIPPVPCSPPRLSFIKFCTSEFLVSTFSHYIFSSFLPLFVHFPIYTSNFSSFATLTSHCLPCATCLSFPSRSLPPCQTSAT